MTALKYLALGGWDGTGVLNSAERFYTHTGIWENVPSMPTKRYQLGSAVLEGMVYAVGGHNGVQGILYRCTHSTDI
jgi:kelch-like protein 20